MTKFILHGGDTRDECSDNDYFYNLFTKGLSGKVKILMNYFARDEERWGEKYELDKEKVLEQSENKDVAFELASLEKFDKQLKSTDVVYIAGGKNAPLLNSLQKFPNIEKLFDNKVVLGCSAGVYVLSKYSYSYEAGEVFKGLGILKIKSICHYKEEDRVGIEKLKSVGEDLEIIVLSDHKVVEMWK